MTDKQQITNSDFVKYSRKNCGGAKDLVRKDVFIDISFSLVLQLNHLG